MNILEIGWEYNIGTGHMGPVTNVICQLARAFHDLGHEVTVTAGVSTDERSLLPAGVQIVELESATSFFADPKARKLSRISKDLSRNSQIPYISEIVETIDLNSFDVVHTHNATHARILRDVFDVPCAYTVHTPLWCDPSRYVGMRGRIAQLKKLVAISRGLHEVNVIRDVDLAIVLGEFVREEVNANNIVVIPNGIDLREWCIADKHEARNALGFSSSEFVLLFAGSIRPIKGLDVLINAVRELNRSWSDFRLIVFGNYSEELEQSTRGLPVELRGFVSNRTEEFRLHLAGADLMIVPSRFDNQPTVILEALAMQLPVVASRVGGIPDMVTDDVGSLFEVGNHLELAKTIRGLRNDSERLVQMSMNCRTKIEAKYTYQRAASQYVHAFESAFL